MAGCRAGPFARGGWIDADREGTAQLTGAVEPTPTGIIDDVIAVVIGGALMLGFLTPVAGTAAAVFSS